MEPWFTLLGSPVTPLEVAGFVLALAMVGCNMREIHWGWPLAAASSVLYGILFAHSKLYGEAGLQVMFVAMAFWGWAQWLRGGVGTVAEPPRVRALTRRGWLVSLAALAVLWPAIALLLDHATDSDVPWFDAFPTALSVIGQVLLGRKFIENWHAWLVVNGVSVALFAHKDLWLTVVLYALFALLSIAGWLAWRPRLATAPAQPLSSPASSPSTPSTPPRTSP